MREDPAFEAFVERCSTPLLRTAYLLTGDRGHAEDLLQVALLRTARRWRTAREAPEIYVRKVLLNLSRDRIRRLMRRPREKPLDSVPDTVGTIGPHDHQVAERRAVVEALARLPIRQRQVIVLRYFEDLTVEQTADLLKMSSGTVKSYTSRGLGRLRELLTDNDNNRIARTHHG
ncbi:MULTISPECIES: SigE family RNA polymerase sigma factor [Micromonospora]|uniref:SigE family RNA polymerase sigma factor n=2 Tax=Micromonospora solifontis TaxID=2487138 RepID=A0ABX9WQN4_9ACTN|nr:MULTISPECIES: SigE family RNA polymerase sigma factor [Micromonospora]NES13225.1 SigE family RNA polymerase sigma factor [Micromonospora sp. PPF5-17B]NES34594.1 SigE family RNA polymerase sigma factor [Micromonospora solifontis]NES57042.1 SigE family RNA polymerase sigma factor [Micromonospora sp. PPF5-6]RNM01962.1 SigE family RNA polymerase sigma factor [Micromonospora solifontis]